MTADWGTLLRDMSTLHNPTVPPGSVFDHCRPRSPTGIMDYDDSHDQTGEDLDGLDDIFSAFTNAVVVPIQGAARTIGVDGDHTTLSRVTDKGAMADSGANVCVTPDSNNLINVRPIPPISLNLALDDGTTQSFECCTTMGYLPFRRTDGTEHHQPFLQTCN